MNRAVYSQLSNGAGKSKPSKARARHTVDDKTVCSPEAPVTQGCTQQLPLTRDRRLFLILAFRCVFFNHRLLRTDPVLLVTKEGIHLRHHEILELF